MASELKRKGAGEDEGSVGKLTAHSNRTEEGRKVELDGRGRRSERPSMAAGGEVVDSAGDWLERARDGAEEVEGKAREVGARRIEQGRRGLAGATPAAALLDSAPPELEENEGRGKRNWAPGLDKHGSSGGREQRRGDT